MIRDHETAISQVIDDGSSNGNRSRCRRLGPTLLVSDYDAAVTSHVGRYRGDRRTGVDDECFFGFPLISTSATAIPAALMPIGKGFEPSAD